MPYNLHGFKLSELTITSMLKRQIIQFNVFEFTHKGNLEMIVKDESYKAAKEVDRFHPGFFLSTQEAWIHALHELQCSNIYYVFKSTLMIEKS